MVLSKRGQVTVFIIIVIVIALTIAVFHTLYQSDKGLLLKNDRSEIAFSKLVIETYVSECFESSVKAGTINVGISDEGELEEYIEQKLEECVAEAIDHYAEQDYQFSNQDNALVDVLVSPKAILARLDYPMFITKDDSEIRLEDKEYSIQRGISSSITTASNGRVQRQTDILSGDGRATLSVRQGIIALDSDGRPLKEVSIGIEEPMLITNKVISLIVYDLQPDGATFSEPGLLLGIDYGDFEFPAGEADVVVMYFDEEEQDYIELPSFDDRENKKVYANLTHFSQHLPALTFVEGTNCIGLYNVGADLQTPWFCIEQNKDGDESTYVNYKDHCQPDRNHIVKYYCTQDTATGNSRCESTVYSCNAYLPEGRCENNKCVVGDPTRCNGIVCHENQQNVPCVVAGINYYCGQIFDNQGNTEGWRWVKWAYPQCTQDTENYEYIYSYLPEDNAYADQGTVFCCKHYTNPDRYGWKPGECS